MARAELRAQISAYRSPFEEEAAGVPDFLALLDDPLAFSRERLEGHFTASAWVVNKKRTHALLTHHRKLGRWLQLGGHADGEEDLAAVAMKEAQEESGLSSLRLVGNDIFDLDCHVIPERGNVPEHYHYDVRYLIEASIDEPLTLSEESMDLAWVPFDHVPDLCKHNHSILRMLEKTSKSELVR
ncbi:NUDIX hydrolase [Nitritalea halalkaliphila LW7]|uniref:NUDIX hydrolase n=1 Tax=Nitritalea halalkaliphila LW7 TaxID=1189621 RepID=I5BYB2_9BACT|nr:NUDIX hydrolase [Nitritalea halalkaliphila]EIM74564.1 NUDIX hydrolase [Nitritalea halalkaliphila LW7]